MGKPPTEDRKTGMNAGVARKTTSIFDTSKEGNKGKVDANVK